ADGGFQFHQLESAAYLVVVRDPALGRGEAWTSTAESDAVVKVIAPTRAIGRVLRRRIPVSNARVRFVPDALAWGVSVDPTEHITIDTYTDDTGRFVMGLPPKITGSLQITDTDGAAVRVPVTTTRDETEIPLGDIAVPDPIRAIVRLVNREGCSLLAAGPVGDLGLTTVRPINTSNVYW